MSDDQKIHDLIESAKAKLTVAEFGALWNVARDDGLAEGLAQGFQAIIGAATIVEVDPSKCPNPWHKTAPARARMICPECPPVGPLSAQDTFPKLAANAAYGQQRCIFENCTDCK